jgi:very-short-patch-repair endonuclease
MTPYSDPRIDLVSMDNLVRSFISTFAADFDRAAKHHTDVQVSPAEVQFASCLIEAKVFDYRQQVPVGPYFVDFVFGKHLGVEIDGRAYHQDGEKERARDAYLLANGLKEVWHIRALEVFSEPLSWIERITRRCAVLEAK